MLVDCEKGCFGCSGGYIYKGFTFYQTNNPMLTSDYPYTSGVTKKEGTCNIDKSKVDNTVKVLSYSFPTARSVSSITAALLLGPVAIALNGSTSSFQLYKSGVYNDLKCAAKLNHATVIVGKGVDAGKNFWLIRNSWGTSWGEGGYIRILVNGTKGICGC
jgi:histolysain